MTGSSTPAGRGRFITIEGPDGGGKSTQARRLERALRDAGIPVLRTREPGGTPFGERIRDLLLADDHGADPLDPLAEAFLFNAARRQLVESVIRPAVEAGTTVVCTRFADSTLAYQGFGAGLPLDRLRALQEVATGGLTPDLTIVLDLPAEVGLDRKPAGDRTRFELGFDIEFHRRVRDGFLELAAADPARFAVVDAGQPADDVWDAVRTVVGERLGLEGSGEPDGLAARIHG
ncbi:MAG TPA: dTMP kinase [Candidatus Limnocylindrales bacterium]|nr:dTMP kinase [Candidatus Limnocylindrales bacterium]